MCVLQLKRRYATGGKGILTVCGFLEIQTANCKMQTAQNLDFVFFFLLYCLT